MRGADVELPLDTRDTFIMLRDQYHIHVDMSVIETTIHRRIEAQTAKILHTNIIVTVVMPVALAVICHCINFAKRCHRHCATFVGEGTLKYCTHSPTLCDVQSERERNKKDWCGGEVALGLP